MHQHEVDAGRLRELIEAFPGAKVTVVGDVIVDHYIWGQVKRISPEAPVPVVDVKKEDRCLGGASNVANNISKLGGSVDIVGMVGQDEPGDWVAIGLEDSGIGSAGLVRLPDRPTTIKTRVIAHNQQVVRFDRETKDSLPSTAFNAVRDTLDAYLEPGRIVVVSDYGKGVVSTPVLNFLRERIASSGIRVCVDPKSRHFRIYKGFTLVTPNQHEAELASGLEIKDDESLRKAGFRLLASLESEALLITRGEAGMSLFSAGDTVHIPTMARDVYDVTGAGDTVLATLAMSLSVGASFLEAALLANLAAGIVVGEVGTSTVKKEELLAALEKILPYVENNSD